MEIKILVAQHKAAEVPADNVFLPIQVGKAISKTNLDIQGDDTGDNISIRNGVYCEMSALYWAWKNLNADYIGLCHYRRIFTTDFNSGLNCLKNKLIYLCSRYFANTVTSEVNFCYNRVVIIDNNHLFLEKAYSFSKYVKLLLAQKKYDAIVPYPYEYASSVKLAFMGLGRYYLSSLKTAVKIVAPELLPFLIKTLNGRMLYSGNMFLFKRSIYLDYCDKTFSILDKQIDIIKKDGWCVDPFTEKAFSRMSGYMGELLTSSYILKLSSDGRKIFKVNTMFNKN